MELITEPAPYHLDHSGTNSIQEVYVINLDRCKKRYQNVMQSLAQHGLSNLATRWKAVDGYAAMNHKSGAHIATAACRSFLCSPGMIGCYRSHYTLWQHIHQRYSHLQQLQKPHQTWFIVFEDDVHILPGFSAQVKAMLQELDAWRSSSSRSRSRNSSSSPPLPYPDWIQLYCLGCDLLPSLTAPPVTAHLCQPIHLTTTIAYMVNLEGIRKLLLHMSPQASWHVDAILNKNMLLRGRLNVYGTRQAIVNTADAFVSTVSSNTVPRLIPDLINSILPASYRNLHVAYDSACFRIGLLSVNCMVVIYLILLGLVRGIGGPSTTPWILGFFMAEIIYSSWVLIKHHQASKNRNGMVDCFTAGAVAGRSTK
jgi:GR25 family glycosyltransferase involved in LPS biosynthesis